MRIYRLLFCLAYVALLPSMVMAEDCQFCKKDHQRICENECIDKGSSSDAECAASCVNIKCAKLCVSETKTATKPETLKPQVKPKETNVKK